MSEKRNFRGSILSSPTIDRLQDIFGHKVYTLGVCHLRGNRNILTIWPPYIAGKHSYLTSSRLLRERISRGCEKCDIAYVPDCCFKKSFE